MSKSTYGTGQNNPYIVSDFKPAEYSTSGYVQLRRTAETEELMKDYKCFMVLTQIAIRARRQETNLGMELNIGEAMIGDYKNIGLTRQQYRTALTKLQHLNLIHVKSTNKGTIATLIDKRIYDINEVDVNQQVTNKQPTSNQQVTTNKNDKNVKNEKNNIFETEIEKYPSLQSDSFLFAWSDWEHFRSEKKKPLTPKSIKEQIRFLSEQPDPVECIRQSIRNDYQGIFKIKGNNNNGNHLEEIPDKVKEWLERE